MLAGGVGYGGQRRGCHTGLRELPQSGDSVYIGETGRTLEKRLSEHRGAVKRNDLKNGIAVHAWKTQHRVDWEAATVKQVEVNHTRRKVIEAIHIKKQKVTSNLDCGRSLSPV